MENVDLQNGYPPPRRPKEIESSKINTMFLTTSSRKLTKDFVKILPVCWENRLWMWTQEAENGQNQYFCGKLNHFSLRPARDLIVSLNYYPLNVLTCTNRKIPFPLWEKFIRPEKWPQSDQKSIFWLWKFAYFQKIAFFDKKYWKELYQSIHCQKLH